MKPIYLPGIMRVYKSKMSLNQLKVSDERIKEITKELIIKSFKDWRANKEKKGITTEHFVLNRIAPNERLTSAVIQSLQTSLGTKFWQNLVNKLAKENGFTICNVKEFYKPKTKPTYGIEKYIKYILSKKNA